MSDKIELNRRRVLGGIATVGAASAAVGAGTFAYFTDSVESQDNTIETGTISLGDVSQSEVTIGPLVPEESTGEQTFSATYEGTVENPTLDWGIEVANDSDYGEGTMAENLSVDTAQLSVGGTPVSNPSGDSLDGLTGVYNDVHDPSDTSLTNDQNVALDLNLTLDNVDNDYQGVTLDFAIAFKARQADAPALELDDITVTTN